MKKSFKTSLAGVLGAFLTLAGPQIGARLSGDTTAPPITSQNYIPAVAILALGLLSKDHDQTGGPQQ